MRIVLVSVKSASVSLVCTPETYLLRFIVVVLDCAIALKNESPTPDVIESTPNAAGKLAVPLTVKGKLVT